MKIFNFHVQDDLHKRLKVYCANSGQTMKEVIVEAINHFLNKQTK